MKQDMKTRVAELSATLKPIDDCLDGCPITGSMVEIAEDDNSYNGSYYCNGWVKPCFEGSFKGVLLEKVEEYQVIREFLINVELEGLAYDETPENWDDDDAPDIPEMELLGTQEFRQLWISRDGIETIVLDEDATTYAFNDESYYVMMNGAQDWVFEPKFRDILLKEVNEVDDSYQDNSFSLVYYLSPVGEMLMKRAPQFNNAILKLYRTNDVQKFYQSLKIALRHHYELPTNTEDAAIYLDYLSMCSRTNRDMTNPKFICVADLAKAHDEVLAVRMREDELRRKQHEAEDRKRAEEAEQMFAERHSYLFDIHFDCEHFHFDSLDSVEEYRVEGNIMHHCVFQCRYYEKDHVLTMHVSDHEGNRVATCSVDLIERRIIELQTMCNEPTWRKGDEYKEIWNCLMARMHTFPKYKPVKKENKQVKAA